MKKLVLLFAFIFFIGIIYAQGTYNLETPDTLFIQPTKGSPQMVVYIVDNFCDLVTSLILDPEGFIFPRTECIYGPCTVYYIYFQNKKMEVQRGETLFFPQKSD